jgi:hypothetical protein
MSNITFEKLYQAIFEDFSKSTYVKYKDFCDQTYCKVKWTGLSYYNPCYNLYCKYYILQAFMCILCIAERRLFIRLCVGMVICIPYFLFPQPPPSQIHACFFLFISQQILLSSHPQPYLFFPFLISFFFPSLFPFLSSFFDFFIFFFFFPYLLSSFLSFFLSSFFHFSFLLSFLFPFFLTFPFLLAFLSSFLLFLNSFLSYLFCLSFLYSFILTFFLSLLYPLCSFVSTVLYFSFFFTFLLPNPLPVPLSPNSMSTVVFLAQLLNT